MKRATRDIQHRLLSQILLAIFVAYFCNVSLFTHSHIINGVTVVHSHIYGGGHTDSNSSQHTQIQLRTIAQIAHFDSDSGFDNNFEFTPYWHVISTIDSETHEGFAHISANNISLRAPPAIG